MSKQPDMWAVVELMGHVRIAGRLTEEERFNTKMGRIDIPQPPSADCVACKGLSRATIEPICIVCESYVTQFFGGSSVYRITFVSEAAARAVAVSNRAAPIHSWELPKIAAPTSATSRDDYDDEDDEPGDDGLDVGYPRD
jgi:hypothetical protein